MIAYWKPFFSRIWRVFFFLSDTQKRSAHWDKYLLFVHKFNLHHSGPKFKGRKKIFLWCKIQIKSFFQNWIFGPKLDFCPSVYKNGDMMHYPSLLYLLEAAFFFSKISIMIVFFVPFWTPHAWNSSWILVLKSFTATAKVDWKF